MKKILFFCLLSLLSALPAAAQPDPYAAYEKRTYVSPQGVSLPYRLLQPETTQKEEKYPLVVFLHGAGEKGDDNALQLTHGGQMWLNPVNRERYPSFVLFPQCPEGCVWTKLTYPDEPGHDLTHEVTDLIRQWTAHPSVDSQRIYILGLSMGGIATFDLCMTEPSLFAAAIPICGNARTDFLKFAKDIPFRIYHGDRDDIVPFEGSRLAYRTLIGLGAQVEYIEYPGVGHDSWDYAFKEKDFLEWMFRQVKK